MRRQAGPITLRRAIAILLRDARTFLRDAQSLVGDGSDRSAAVLQTSAVDFLVELVALSERGLDTGADPSDLAAIPDANPVKVGLAELSVASPSVSSPTVAVLGRRPGERCGKLWLVPTP